MTPCRPPSALASGGNSSGRFQPGRGPHGRFRPRSHAPSRRAAPGVTSPAIAPTPMGARRVHPSRVMPRAGSGSTIPKGSRVVLVLASGSRDPARVRNPDRFGLAWPPSPSRSTPR